MDDEQIEIKDELIDHQIDDSNTVEESLQIKSEPSTINKKSTKPLVRLKIEPKTVAESGIFVKPEPDIKPEIFIGVTESDLSQGMSNLSDDPLRISVHEEKKTTYFKV